MWTGMTFDPIRSMAIELVGLFKNLDRVRFQLGHSSSEGLSQQRFSPNV